MVRFTRLTSIDACCHPNSPKETCLSSNATGTYPSDCQVSAGREEIWVLSTVKATDLLSSRTSYYRVGCRTGVSGRPFRANPSLKFKTLSRCQSCTRERREFQQPMRLTSVCQWRHQNAAFAFNRRRSSVLSLGVATSFASRWGVLLSAPSSARQRFFVWRAEFTRIWL